MAALATQATDPDLALLLGAVEGFHLKQFAPPDQATVLAASNLATALILPACLAGYRQWRSFRIPGRSWSTCCLWASPSPGL
jgi:hypothetical protein